MIELPKGSPKVFMHTCSSDTRSAASGPGWRARMAFSSRCSFSCSWRQGKRKCHFLFQPPKSAGMV